MERFVYFAENTTLHGNFAKEIGVLSWRYLWIKRCVDSRARTEMGNRRGGTTKKREISRTLLSINLHSVESPSRFPLLRRMAVLCFVGTQPLPWHLLGLYPLRKPHALYLDTQHGCHDFLGCHRVLQPANSCWKFGRGLLHRIAFHCAVSPAVSSLGRPQTFVELQLCFKLHFYTREMQFET